MIFCFFWFLLRKSIDWFLYDNGFRHERVHSNFNLIFSFQAWGWREKVKINKKVGFCFALKEFK